MAKTKTGRGFDPIADAHELAEHNINPYYYFNRVNSFTYARMMAQRRLAFLYLPPYLCALSTVVVGIITARANGISYWDGIRGAMMDNPAGAIYYFISILLCLYFSVAYLVMIMQYFAHRKLAKSLPRPAEQKKSRKRQPKHRKDYR